MTKCARCPRKMSGLPSYLADVRVDVVCNACCPVQTFDMAAVQAEILNTPTTQMQKDRLHRAKGAKASKAARAVKRRKVGECVNCGDVGPLPADNRCGNCYAYRNRNGVERPKKLWKRKAERVRK